MRLSCCPGRLGKARTAFFCLSPVWRSKLLGRKTKLRIFNTSVKSILLCGSETWRTTKERPRLSKISVSEQFQEFIGQIPSQTKTYGKQQDKRKWDWRSREDAGDGWVTLCAIQIPTLSSRPWDGTHRGSGREGGQGTAGDGQWVQREMREGRLHLNWQQLKKPSQDKEGWRDFLRDLWPPRGESV